mmetsp:Transcript_72407/g.204680  ORF Transcript_72407/g.204680 Transcript_72407/m.204680 type:complete len:210 (-) Transcript_72407:1441-2070(-)
MGPGKPTGMPAPAADDGDLTFDWGVLGCFSDETEGVAPSTLAALDGDAGTSSLPVLAFAFFEGVPGALTSSVIFLSRARESSAFEGTGRSVDGTPVLWAVRSGNVARVPSVPMRTGCHAERSAGVALPFVGATVSWETVCRRSMLFSMLMKRALWTSQAFSSSLAGSDGKHVLTFTPLYSLANCPALSADRKLMKAKPLLPSPFAPPGK